MLDGDYLGFEVVTDDEGVTLITFNEPDRLNGLSRGMLRDLHEILNQAQTDDDTRVVVITGTGRGFCAGDDVFESLANPRPPTLVPPQVRSRRGAQVNQYPLLRTYSQELIRSIRNLDKLTIASINGVAIQIGLSIALACDFRIAADDARLGSATLRFAFLPDEGGHWLLLQHLGITRTLDFLMRSRIVTAQEALELGLVTEVVAADELRPRTMGLAHELATGPQVAMRLLKRSLYNALNQTFEQAGDDIAGKTAISDHHPDTVEGMAAFRAKRTPRFNQWLDDPPQGDGTPAWQQPPP
ncbi:MAG TPA: enoyl-CoA hydratase/isomerase family protein [Vicinamibacterales bacterium]